MYLFCTLDGTGPLQWPGGPSSKPGKPKGKKKCSSRQKFDVRLHSYSSLQRLYFSIERLLFWICQNLNNCTANWIFEYQNWMWMFLWLLQHRFQPQNPLSAAQPFSPREVGGEEEELRLSCHTLLLPTRGQLEARMMVTAFELGLDNITEDAVSTMVYAVEVCSIYTSSTLN